MSNPSESGLTVTTADHNKTFQMSAGELIILHLAENLTTGFRWEFEEPEPESLEVVSSQYVRASGGGIGSGGKRVITLRPTAAGSHSIRLKHWQSWSGEESVTERFQVDLDVI